jgi:hypothetical protein
MSDETIEIKVSKQLVELVGDWQDCLVLAEQDEEKGIEARGRFKERVVPTMARLIIATVRGYDAVAKAATEAPKPTA